VKIGAFSVNIEKRIRFQELVNHTHPSKNINHQQLLHYRTVWSLFFHGYIVGNAPLSLKFFLKFLKFHFFYFYPFIFVFFDECRMIMLELIYSFEFFIVDYCYGEA